MWVKIVTNFLGLLTEMAPPDNGAHHTLTVEDNKLIITIYRNKKFRQYTIDRDDANKSVQQLVDELYEMDCQRSKYRC